MSSWHDFHQSDQLSSLKSILNISIYFEEIATYIIVIKKYQSAMLIQVINYKDKIVSAPSSKS